MSPTIPTTARALVLDAYDSDHLAAVRSLHIVERPVPTPGPGQVLVRVEAAACNPSDIIFLTDAAWGESAETVAARPGWDLLTAVREGHVVAVDQDTSGRWGPRVVDFIESVKSIIEGSEG